MPAHSKKTSAITTEILNRLSKGEPLAQICRDEGMPSSNTFRDWCAANEDLAIAYARARDEGFDAIALEALTIIDQKPERYATELGDRVDGGYVQWAKNRAEQRLKLLAKWDPRRYGDKIAHVGGDKDDAPIRSEVAIDVTKLSEATLRELAGLKVEGGE